MFHFRFRNSNDAPIFVQVDPWAGLYRLGKGDEIEFAADCEGEKPQFGIEEFSDTRILTLWNSSEYFVVLDGRLVPWTDFQTNLAE